MNRRRPLGKVPYVVDETESYAVVYKPPLMFSAPQGSPRKATLLDWYARRCPAILDPAGGRQGEGGLLHRLDFETEGLVLFAKTQAAYESLSAQQGAGEFVKEYLALTFSGPLGEREGGRRESSLPGFPPPPDPGSCIESCFRPWGPGRRAVRPVTAAQSLIMRKKRGIARDRGNPYRTEILAVKSLSPDSDVDERNGPGSGKPRLFHLRIRRGFRHQIRCHLAWIGEPILYDALYGWEGRPGDPAPPDGEKHPIALRAAAFCFFDPGTGSRRSYRLPAF
jgi:23S rRNA pseudouridine1911/1915/1917 synthase